MKIQITHAHLLQALIIASRAVSQKPQLPILQNLLLEAKEKTIRIVATNLETTLITTTVGKIEKEGAVCVPARLFGELVGTLPNDTITLSSVDTTLHIETQKTKTTLPTVPSAEFPPIDVTQEGQSLRFESKQLKTALDRVLFSAATDDGRPLLTGLRLLTTEEAIVFAATDGYRLSVQQMTNSTNQQFDMVVPARALIEVQKNIITTKEDQDIVLVKTRENQLVITVENTTIATRLIDGEYPNFSKIIPKTHTTEVRFVRDDLAKAVKSAAIFARDNANIVKLQVEKTGVIVSANAAQVGENTIVLEADVSGEGGEIAFNSRFLLDFLNNYTEEEVFFQMTGALNPGVFKQPKDDSYLHIIMPVRVQV